VTGLRAHALLWLASIALAAPAAAAAPTLDSLADDFVVVAMASEKIAPDVVGTAVNLSDWAGRKRVKPTSRYNAVAELKRIVLAIDAMPMPADKYQAMRQRGLRVKAVSLASQLQPRQLAALPVAEQVRRLYGFEPVFRPLTDYDAAIEKFATEMPGSGSLYDRINAMKARAMVPPDRIEPVVRAAVAECRKRTASHLRMPKEELAISFPADSLVPAQSNYTGGGKGAISVSSTIPADVDRLLQTACHEAYPGHHTHSATLDERLWTERKWPETGVFLSYSPVFPVSDAISEYGVGLVFPLDERMRFEREVLYPLAGLTMQDEAGWRALISARSSVLGATSTIIRDYLDKKIDDPTAKQLAIRYRLMTPQSADQLLKMAKAFGPDLLASDQGWLAIDRAFEGKPVEEKWRLLQRMEEEPMLLGDVRALATAH
jgi:hypothetical protein